MTVIRFQVGEMLDVELHKALFWDHFFLLYVNDLPNIKNNTLAHVIFTDDISNLIANSNLILVDYKKY